MKWRILLSGKNKTRGPWWPYIAHLTKQICIFTVEVSAKFTALGFLYKFYSTNHPHPPPPHPRPCFFYKSWRLELNLKRGSPKEHFCQVILKLVQWFKKFYIAIKPYALTAMFFDESWTNLVEGHQRNIPAKLYWNLFSGFWQEDF